MIVNLLIYGLKYGDLCYKFIALYIKNHSKSSVFCPEMYKKRLV